MSRPKTLVVGGTVYWVLRTYDPTDGVTPIDADSTPTVAVRKGPSSVGDSVTVTKRSATTGIYDCSHNPSGEAEGDQFTYEETATISSTDYTQSWSLTVAAVERGTDSAATPTNVSDAQTAILGKLPPALVGGRIDASVGAFSTDAKSNMEFIVGKYHNVRQWPVKNDAAWKSPIASDNNFATWPGIIGPISSNYYLTYTAIDGSGKTCIRIEGLGTDLDNLTPDGSPVTILSADQVYDAGGLFLSSACEISGSTVRLYYCGTPSANANHQICLATCPTSGITNPASWTKQGVMIAYNSGLLPAGLQQGIEPTGYLEFGGFHWLYGCSVPNGNRPTPASGGKVIITDRRGFVAKSSSATDWSAAEIRMLMSEDDQPSRTQPYRYMISPHVFRQGSASNSVFYLLAACDATNTDYQRGVVFSSPDPWFDQEYTQEEFTFLLTRDADGTFPTGEIDVFSVLTTDSEKDTYTNSKFRVVFGARDLNATWSCGLIELPTIHEALRPGYRGAAHNVQRMLAMRAGSAIEERASTQAATVATNLNAAVSSRLASASYTAPDNATIAAGAASAASAAISAGVAATNSSTILDRIGAFAGSGVNTILGFFRALAAKASGLTPSDLSSGTTYDNTVDSQEAIRDRGDAAWTGSGGGGGGASVEDIVAGVMGKELLGGVDVEDGLNLLLAAAIGEAEADGDTETFKHLDGTDAFTTTFDTSNNRVSIELH